MLRVSSQLIGKKINGAGGVNLIEGDGGVAIAPPTPPPPV